MTTIEETNDSFKEGKAIGGNTGSSFNDAQDLNLIINGVDRHCCVSVELHWDENIEKKLSSICFNYGKTNDESCSVGKHRGRDRGKVAPLDHNQATFILKSDDAIEKILVYVGKRQRFVWDEHTIPVITGIQFHTIQGDVSDLYGSSKDAQEITDYFPGYTFAYAKGRAGLWIDQLQFVWTKTQADPIVPKEIAHF